jgi:hypothetical protein
MIIGRSSTKFVFFMPIGDPRWPPPIIHLQFGFSQFISFREEDL